MNETHSRILQLWREGKTPKEIVNAMVPLSWPPSRISNFLCIARDLLGVEAVPIHEGCTPDHLLKQVAELWRSGLSTYEIAARLERYDAPGLVQAARRKLGTEAVPMRAVKRKKKAAGLMTMLDADRHFLRHVGNEYIFRNANGKEESWIKGEKGLLFRKGNFTVPLVFRTVLGMTEPRTPMPLNGRS